MMPQHPVPQQQLPVGHQQQQQQQMRLPVSQQQQQQQQQMMMNQQIIRVRFAPAIILCKQIMNQSKLKLIKV